MPPFLLIFNCCALCDFLSVSTFPINCKNDSNPICSFGRKLYRMTSIISSLVWCINPLVVSYSQINSAPKNTCCFFLHIHRYYYFGYFASTASIISSFQQARFLSKSVRTGTRSSKRFTAADLSAERSPQCSLKQIADFTAQCPDFSSINCVDCLQ